MSATQTAADPSEDPGAGVAARIERRRDWSIVLVPWLLSRLVSVGALVVTARQQNGRWSSDPFYLWDGVWYLRIATWGYGGPLVDPSVQTPWPFFPLLPGVGRLLHEAGAPLWVGMALLGNVAFVVGLAGVHRLARSSGLGLPEARFAVWVVAFFPASVVFSMIYPSSLFLAGTVWAFVFARERRPGWCALAATVAVLVRPNGFLVLAPLALALVWPEGDSTVRERGRTLVVACGPPLLALLGWMALMQRWAGDALVFYRAKAGWDEVQLHELFSDPFPGAVVHALVGGFALLAVLLAARRMPASWTLLAAVLLLPSMGLGVIGLGRYSNEAFPVAMAMALLAGRHANRLLPVLAAGGVVGMVLWSNGIARLLIVP